MRSRLAVLLAVLMGSVTLSILSSQKSVMASRQSGAATEVQAPHQQYSTNRTRCKYWYGGRLDRREEEFYAHAACQHARTPP